MESRALMLADLTWPEVQRALETVQVVLIPVGSTEQHGPNLATRCDAALAEAVCRRLEARLRPRVLVAPTLPYGVSHHHMAFPGTVTLSEQTLTAVAVEVAGSLLAHGLRRLLFVNGHGGNLAALATACGRVRRELAPDFVACCTYYNAYDPAVDARFPDSGKGGHACGMEVSLALELAPEIVRREALAAAEPGPRLHEGAVVLPLARRKALDIPYGFEELTRNGCMGDATKASPEYGAAMVASALDEIEALIELAAARGAH